MSEEDREAEDVAGLFRKFGGDVKGYREFEPTPATGQTPAAWTLIPGSAAPAQAPTQAAAPAAVTAPAPIPIPALRQAEPAAPPPVPPPAFTAAAPRELDLLFARLAGQPPSTPAGSHGLMSRWRKPS